MISFWLDFFFLKKHHGLGHSESDQLEYICDTSKKTSGRKSK